MARPFPKNRHCFCVGRTNAINHPENHNFYGCYVEINENFKTLKWRYCIIVLAMFCGDIPCIAIIGLIYIIYI
jgi:hypothetical protein